MYRRSFIASVVFVAVFTLGCGSLLGSAQDKRGRKYKAPAATAKIQVTVLKDFNGKPIENASVIFHGVSDSGNMELKSDEDGKAIIDVLPIGDTVRLQIIAKGYQTYGGDYKVAKDDMAIEIRMKRPGEQYSIYKDHAGDKKDDNSSKPQDKPQ